MRPIRLRIEGLRSYRNEVTVEFSDVNLLAIIGDTGAGKSSILEAITYALYGASTWSGQPGDLISDSCPTMRVEFEFSVDGRRWIARRSMSRSGYPAPVHHLECADTNEKIDGRNDVNKAVTRLLGLDSAAFLQTVLLPQGRFAELLWATGGDRNKVLKNIFRVDELEAIRDRAKRLAAELKPKRELLASARALLLPDPQATEREAEERFAIATARVKDLERAKTMHDTDVAQATEHDTLAATATRVLRAVGELSIDDIPAQFAHLAELDSEFRRKLEQSVADIESATSALGAKRDEIAVVVATHSDHASLTSIRDQLIEIQNQVGVLAEDAQRIATDRAMVATQTAAIADLQTKADTARAELESATTGRDTAAKASEQAVQVLTRARDALCELRSRAATRAEADAAVALALTKRNTAEEDLAIAAAKVSETEQVLEVAKQGLDAAARHHAAAEAAHGTHAGDPCPICERPLPDGFSPPVAEALTALKRDVKKAEADERAARSAQSEKTSALAVATSELEGIKESLEATITAYNDQLSVVVAAVGDPHTEDSLTRTLDEPDDYFLAALSERVTLTRSEYEGAAQQLASATEAAQSAITECDRVKGALDAIENRLAGEESSARQRVDNVANLANDIDERFRPDVKVLIGDGSLEFAQEVDMTEPLARLDAALAHATQLAEQERERERTRERVVEANRKLSATHAREVTTPARAQLERLDRAYGALGSAVTELAISTPLDVPPDHDDLAACSQWAAGLNGTAEAVKKAGTTALREAHTAAEAARTAAASALTQVGVATVAELQAHLVEAATDARDRERQLMRARHQAPVAADLDHRLDQTAAFLEAISCLQTKLADGAFIADLIARRQRALLGVATAILAEMTSERYGFASDFQIVDRVSGLARAAKTLSGGESFLASLALALAMVEIAGRAGGRLDALFLDEGFGALDTNNLDTALDALEARARAGRLIVVISHVLAVAERVPDVLAVRPGASGATEVSWLSEADRTGAVDSEISDALSGLLA
jgi:exonuclease SbcC